MNIIEKLDRYINSCVNEEDSAYQTFFKSKLKEWDVESVDELDDEEKKDFFAEVEKEWTKEKD